jgi:hypothetical protein
LVEFSVDAPAGLIGGNRILLLPATAGILVEIYTGVDGLVDGSEIEAWGIREFGGTRGLRVCCGRGQQGEGGQPEDGRDFHGYLSLRRTRGLWAADHGKGVE